MGLKGKLASQTSVKSDGNKFYELIKYRPNDFSEISPQTIQSVELCGGQWGTVGSYIRWNFTTDGKKMTSTTIIEAIDEAKKSITFTAVEGDLVGLYKTLKFICKVDTNGEDNTVTWTIEYEKKSEAGPNTSDLMNVCLAMTKDAERHHLLVPN